MEDSARRSSEGLGLTNRKERSTIGSPLPFRSKKKLSYPEVGVDPYHDKSEPSDHPPFASQTPQKSTSLQPVRSADDVKWASKRTFVRNEDHDSISRPSIKVPETESLEKIPPKYESLRDQFDSLVSSIRLLRLKGRPSTFTNIYSSVKVLTKKEFSRRHLAQLKFLMPECINIATSLFHDEKTCCMKPEILVTLRPEALKDGALKVNGGNYLDLSKVFHSRLVTFIKSKQEDVEIPEEILPEPFSQRTKAIYTDGVLPETADDCHLGNEEDCVHLRTNDGSTIEVNGQPLGSFFSRFHQRLSKKIPILESEKTQLLSLSTTCGNNDVDTSNSISSASIVTSCTTYPLDGSMRLTTLQSCSVENCSTFSTPIISTPSKDIVLGEDLDLTPLAPSKVDVRIDDNLTPAVMTEPVSTPARLMSSTPDLFTPKRAKVTPNFGCTSCTKTQRYVIKPKALNFFSPISSKGREHGARMSSVDEQVVSSFDPTHLKLIEENQRNEDNRGVVLEVKERQKIMSFLPKLFDMICLIFQSSKSHCITKQELVYKIIVQHLDIVDREEVEEQLGLLQMLIPDWISLKKDSNGDCIFCMSNTSSHESLRSRLIEAARVDAL